MFDIIIIGSGPGGYVAAIRAAQLGMKAAIVEREHLGGICLNWGCIPTKALLRSADVFHIAERGREFGLSLAAPNDQNIDPIVVRSRKIARQLNEGVAYLLKKNAITLIAGEGSLQGAKKVLVRPPAVVSPHPKFPFPKEAKGEGIYEAKHIVIATGARPRVIPGLEPDGHLIWTYYDAMIPKQMPKSLLVLGSGAIGIEFASFYRAMGVDVTLVEAQNRIMPAEDIEISALVRKLFERRGIKVLTSSTITGVEKSDDSLTASIQAQDGSRAMISADRLITAVGTTANIEGLCLETGNVMVQNSFIAVDAYGRTNAAGLYAIGDVAGPPMLAHKAEHEGVICVEAIAGHTPRGLDKTSIPACTYGEPQVASIGLTQDNAEKQGIKVAIGRFPFAANGKAIASGEPDGLIKTLFNADTGKLIGAHMVGAEVSELIQGFAIAMACGATIKELTAAVFPHPTLSEIMHESCLQAAGRALHL